MGYGKLLLKAIKHRELIFLAGSAAVVVGKKIIESEEFKEMTSNAVANARVIRQDAEAKFSEIRDDVENRAQDVDFKESEKKVKINID
ncbi:hypothetical protein [Methanobrevibacter sp.]|uniref:hypothetical protein n=1 Tax=Methanobrevibacter sp. TaxID=66852 RepID=UPI0038908D8F